MSRALLSRVFAPQGVQVVNASAARRLPLPNKASDAGAVVLAHFAGRPRAVQRRIDESARLLQAGGATELEHLEQGPAARLLCGLADLGWTAGAAPDLGLRANVSPTQVARAANWGNMDGLAAWPGVVADPGFGSVRLLWWEDAGSGDLDDPAAIAAIRQIRVQAAGCGGSVAVEHCPLSVKQQIDVWGESPELIELMKRIKNSFDPSGTLNPGRFLGRL